MTEANYGALDPDGDGKVTLYAAYDLNPVYTVSYDVEGFGDTNEYEEGSIVTILPDIPEKEGHTFKGWVSNIDGNVYRPDSIFQMGANSIELTALWKPTVYTITFKDDDGNEELKSSEHTYNEVVELQSLNNKEGYNFIGWKYGETTITDNTLTMPSSNVTLVSVWERHEYHVNLHGVASGEIDSNSGFGFVDPIYQAIVKYQDEITLPTPVREGYKFIHWVSGTDITDTTETYNGGAILTVGAAHKDLTADFEINSYSVNYEPSEDSEELKDTSDNLIVGSSEEYNTRITLPTPVFDGHKFVHWVDQDGKTFAAGANYVIPAHGTTFKATWTKVEWIVRFVDAHDNINYDTISVTHGTMISATGGTTVTFPTVTKPGHKFEHWEYEGNKVDTVIEVLSDLVMKAVFTIIPYTVQFNDGDATTFPDITQNYNSQVTIPSTSPKKNGHSFNYWVDQHGQRHNTGATFNMPVGGLILTPDWTVEQYTVTFKDEEDNKLFTPVTEDYGNTIPLPHPIKTGYTFAGWKLGDATLPTDQEYKITADVDLVASWIAHEYDVTFDYRNGKDIVTEKYSHDSKITFTLPVRAGYTFKGWYFDEKSTYQEGGTFTVTTAGLVFTALWQANQYAITFAEPGDTTIDSITAAVDSIVQFPFPTKKGYEFDGWKAADRTYHAYEEITMPVDGIAVTGIWNIRSFDLTFDHGYDGISTTEKVEYASSVTFADPEARVGYTFKGWMLGDKLYNAESTFEMSDENVTFVAVWEANPYKISFKDTGDTQLEDVVVEYDSTYTMPIPVKNGYKFDYWMDEQGNIYRAHEVITMKDGHLVLTAKWTKIETETEQDKDEDTTTPEPDSDPEPTPDPVVTPTPVVTPAPVPTVKPSVSSEKVDPPVTVEPDDQVEEVIPELPEDKTEPETTPEVEYEESGETLGDDADGVCWICKKHTPFIFGICIRCFIIICICIAIILTMIERKIRKERRKRLERQSQEVS